MQPAWDEQTSQLFADYGRYFVPDRTRQIETICALIPPQSEPFNALELCIGEGLLADAILQRNLSCTLHGYDGSHEMLKRARKRLAVYKARFRPKQFDLASRTWRRNTLRPHAVVSSLAIHHLDGEQKQMLFRDVWRMLEPGGVFVIADVVEPTTKAGWQVAAETYDEVVRTRALELDGTLRAFEAFEQTQWNLFRHFDPADYDKPSPLFDQLKWLEQAGFVAVDIHWMVAGHAIFAGLKEAAMNEPRMKESSA